MRYLSILFFCFLSLHSYFVFAQGPSDGGAPSPVCASQGVTQWVSQEGLSLTNAQCLSVPQSHNFVLDSTPDPYYQVRCDRQCTCPEGSTWHQGTNDAGVPASGCEEEEEEEEEECEFGETYDPVTGTASCNDGDGNESSAAASSSACVVPNDFNGDCVPDDQQTSSTPPTSSPDSGSSGSAASSGGDDGDPDNPGNGGGGDNGGGGNNNGGGSASSSASTSSKAAATASSAGSSGAGQCDPTAKNYLACIGSQKMSGEDIPWVPNSGYGNWLPVNENSPCVNKYQDASGQWWCAAPSNNGSGSGAGSSSGTATSSGTGSSVAGQCDSTSKDYLKCISSGNSSEGSASSIASSGASSSANSGAYSSLGDKGEFDPETSEKRLDELKQELEDKIADIKQDIQGEFGGTINGSGSLQDFCETIRNTQVCFGMKKFEAYLDPISAAVFLVACVLSFSIVLRG